MKKDIKDYLHYYIGQEYWIENSGGVYQKYIVDGIKPKFDEHKKITVNQLLLTPVIDELDVLNEPTCSFWEWPHKGKFALRPLSDINYDDIILWAAKCISLGHTDAERATEEDFEYAINHVKENGLKGFDFSNLPELVPESICFLTKQGFDLFGLLEAGLAINATILNKSK